MKLLIPLLFMLTANAWAQIGASPVTVAQLNAAEEQVSTGLATDDPQREVLLRIYSETRAALVSIPQFRESQKNYALSRSNAVAEAKSIQDKLAGLQAAPDKETDATSLVKLPIQELEQQLQVDRAELAARKSKLTDIRAAIDSMPGRPSEIRTRLTELVGLIDDLEAQIALMDKNTKPGSEDQARLWRAQARAAGALAEKAALDEELLSQPMRQKLLKAQQDQNSHDIAVLENRLSVLVKRAGELRQGEATQARAEAELARAYTHGKHQLVQQLADENARLSATFGPRSAAIVQLRQRDATVSGRADQLETDLQSIRRKLEIIGMNKVVGQILREQQARLPERRQSRTELAAVSENIAESSLRQVELEDERRQLRDASQLVQRMLAGQQEQVAERISDDLLELTLTRRDLIAQAVELENTYSQALGSMDANLRRQARAADDFREFVSERLLWIPSREMFSLLQGGTLLDPLAEIISPSCWFEVIRVLPQEVLQQPLTILLIVLFLLLAYFTARLVELVAATSREVGFVHTDRFSGTVLGLGLSLLLSVKWPLLLLILARLFEMQGDEAGLCAALYAASMRTALYAWGLGFQRVLLLPKGLIDAHFRWPSGRTAALYQRVVRLEQTFLPATFLVVLVYELYPLDDGGPLGALAVIVLLLSLAHFFYRMPGFVQGKVERILTDRSSKGESRLGGLVRQLLVWAPLAAVVGVLLGYTYTAIEFALLLIRTVGLFALLFLLHELGMRWLRMTRRRMAAKVRAEQAQAADEETEISPEDELLENDPALLNDEGTKLINVLTLFGGLVGVVMVWAQIFPALGILDSVELWQQTGVVDGREVPVPVTLRNLFSALAILVVGWVALRRIPGLLEILLRQKMSVQPATAYAFTQVMQYVAVIILVIVVPSSLGADWSQIQWAVAALSVGIGFGLQEIVANFISGLIILFEQPIRLGDTVTVGEISGRVTRIQIRATTIRDFDQRELLVPNKEFITKQLLNWSLTDPVTRIMVDVGVAYGTDMDKAITVVSDVVHRHPLVLAEPEPLVTFAEFGDNSLLIRLRFFMDELDKRLSVTSEIRLEINRRFNDAGIVVAFTQRDVHLDAAQPLEITMVNQPK